MSPILSMPRSQRRLTAATTTLLLAALAGCSESGEPGAPSGASSAGAAGTTSGDGSDDGAPSDPNAVAAPSETGGSGALGAASESPVPSVSGGVQEPAPGEKTPSPSTPAEPAVRFVGRFDTSDPAGPRFAWSGSGMIARFSGTSVGVRLAGNQQYTVVVDGVVQPKLVSTGSLDSLATGLAAGEHSVELYRRTEASQGEAQFLGFDFGGGALLAPPPAPERRIEIIGDSISAGYGDEGPDMSCPFSADTENHYLTYGAIAARNVGADLVTVAWSGRGVVCNYGDEPTSCDDPMPTLVDRILPAQPASVWNFALYQPQAVIINLGTNDFSTMVDPTNAEFEAAYVTLLERVRAAYPDATILCTVGPLLNGTDLATARSTITNAVQARIDAGDGKVETFELAETDPANGYGCDYHPSQRTHQIMADTLTATLRTALGWTTVN
jgi:lysophospholipase L1-like esterase